MSSSTVHPVIIIGSGPAGYTAALYTARAQLSPLVIEGATYGGELMNTTEVENFPGFPEGITGPVLMESMRAQAERFGAQFISDDVTKVRFIPGEHVVEVGDDTYYAQAVIVATGSSWLPLNVPGEQDYLGKGVSSCATCDGFFFTGHDIAVVGGGDSAMEEATFLTRFAKSVTIIHRRDSFRASKIMVDRALSNPKITVLKDTVVDKVIGEKTVTGVQVHDVHTGDKKVLPVTGLFIAIGHAPRNHLFINQLDCDAAGYVKVHGRTTATNIPGVFAAGDLVDNSYRQAITAAGSGCQAALDTERYLAALD